MKTTMFPACEVRFSKDIAGKTATFFLAAEEYVAGKLPGGDYLFSWILPPTVVMGRNQVAHQEFDLDYCAAHGIDIVRRKSGGGAVFADHRNIMWSLITRGGDVEPIFKEYAEAVAAALTRLGATAKLSGRNDIILENGGKVCGNAFYHLKERNIVHGTMLYDTNMEAMQRALRPAPEKLKAKGVQSVRSRIGLLKDYISGGTLSLRDRLTALLTNRHITLSEADIAAIEEIERTYREPDFLFGHIQVADEVVSARIEGCGTIELHFTLRGSRVSDVSLKGDFFATTDAQCAFGEAFKGTPFTTAHLQARAKECSLHATIRGLTPKALDNLLSIKSENSEYSEHSYHSEISDKTLSTQ
ncbi:MAG: lipoyltransferase [Bacteroidaceae bacterium]|nr:lipoyltransferase [Bacteroidaceae bacterium]